MKSILSISKSLHFLLLFTFLTTVCTAQTKADDHLNEKQTHYYQIKNDPLFKKLSLQSKSIVRQVPLDFNSTDFKNTLFNLINKIQEEDRQLAESKYHLKYSNQEDNINALLALDDIISNYLTDRKIRKKFLKLQKLLNTYQYVAFQEKEKVADSLVALDDRSNMNWGIILYEQLLVHNGNSDQNKKTLIQSKLNRAKKAMTLFIVFEPMKNEAFEQYPSSNIMSHLIDHWVKRTQLPDDIKFILKQETKELKSAQFKHKVSISLSKLNIIKPEISIHQETISSNKIKVGTESINQEESQQFISAKAELKTMTKEIFVEGLLTITIVDTKKRSVVLNENIKNIFRWHTDWAELKGDIRALNTAQKSLVDSKELSTPEMQELVKLFCSSTFDLGKNKLKRHYGIR